MNRRIYTLPVTFITISSLIALLGIYVLTTKTSLHPQFFITTCGEVLKNVREHVHFNPDGILSSLILLATVVGSSLAIFQAVKFAIANRRLSSRLQGVSKLPEKLTWVINKHHLENTPISVIDGKPTAFTISLFIPRIVISSQLIKKTSPQQLEAVILHELYHLRNRHLLWLLLSRLISSLFFFIPLIEYLSQQLKTEFELTADSFVIKEQKTRDHLCGSLALNLQYTDGIIPHFATSPIEKRVESLITKKASLDKIGITRFALSLLSITIMIGLAVTQPNQITAGFHDETAAVCRIGEKCQTRDCMDLHSSSY